MYRAWGQTRGETCPGARAGSRSFHPSRWMQNVNCGRSLARLYSNAIAALRDSLCLQMNFLGVIPCV